MSQSLQFKKAILMAAAISTVVIPMLVSSAIRQDREDNAALLCTSSVANVLRAPAERLDASDVSEQRQWEVSQL